MFFLNPANHIRFFSVILESDIDTGYIHWTLTLFQSEKFQLKFSQYVCCLFWARRCIKIIAARLLKLAVSYIHIESVWHLNTEPRFFRTRFVKSYTSLEVDFLDNVVTLQKNFKKKYLTQVPTIVEGLQLHSSTQ